jgi:hypothetical protein
MSKTPKQVLQKAFESRKVMQARQTRSQIAAQLRGQGGEDHVVSEGEEGGASAGTAQEQDDDENRRESAAAGVRPSDGDGEEQGKRQFVGNPSKENALGRRKQYGYFLPLPGHVGGPVKANAWDAEDVSVVSNALFVLTPTLHTIPACTVDYKPYCLGALGQKPRAVAFAITLKTHQEYDPTCT